MGSEQYMDDNQEFVDLPRLVMSSINSAPLGLMAVLERRYAEAKANIQKRAISLAQTFISEDGRQEMTISYRNLDKRLEVFPAEVTDVLQPVVKEVFDYAWDSTHRPDEKGRKRVETIVSLDDTGYLLTVRMCGEQLTPAQRLRIQRFEKGSPKEKITSMLAHDADAVLSDMRLLVFYDALREIDGVKMSVRDVQDPRAVEVSLRIPYNPQLWVGGSFDEIQVPEAPDFRPTYAQDPSSLEDAVRSVDDVPQIAVERLYLREALVDGLRVLVGKYADSLRVVLQSGRGTGKKIRPTIPQSYGSVVLDLFVGEDYKVQRTPALDKLVFDIAESLSELGGLKVSEVAMSANKDAAKGLYVVEIRSNGEYQRRIEVPLVELGIPQSQKI